MTYTIMGGACAAFVCFAQLPALAALSADVTPEVAVDVATPSLETTDITPGAQPAAQVVQRLNTPRTLVSGGLDALTSGPTDILSNHMSLSAPDVFAAIGVNDWHAEISGHDSPDVQNGLAGTTTNIVYLPPVSVQSRLGTLRIGISYSSTLRDCLVELCDVPESFSEDVRVSAGLQSLQSWADVFETAVYYEKVVGGTQNGLRLGVGARYVSADEDAHNFEDAGEVYKSYALGMNVVYRGLTVEGAVKNASTPKYNLVDDTGEYLAFDAGITFETGGWGFMLAYGAGNDTALDAVVGPIAPAFYRETKSAQAGVTYVFDHGVTLGAAAQIMQADLLDFDRPGSNAEAAVLIESAIRF